MTANDLIAAARANGLTVTVGKPATLPGVPRPAGPKAPDVRTRSGGRWAVSLTLKCRVVSEANRRDHWTVKRRRVEIQAGALRRALASSPAGWSLAWWTLMPVAVTWTHLGRTMDDDNLRSGFKGLRDELARVFGIDDGDPRVSWRYGQRVGTPGVELRIEGGQ